jgi:hypothetical protein
MQSPRSIQPAIDAMHTSFRHRPPEFRKSGKPRIALTKLSREDHYKPDKVPNGVRWKNLLRRHLPSPLPAGNLLP